MSAELDKERAALVRADCDIADGTDRIRAQESLLQAMRASGRDTRTADRLLCSMQGSLQAWQVHRALIRDRVDYLFARERR